MDPPFAGKFVFSVEGLTIGAFTEVSGLSVSIDVEELAEGGQNQYTHKLPGRMKWPNLVLKRGITETDNLFQWFATSSGDGFAGAGNKIQRRAGRVGLRAAAGRAGPQREVTGAHTVEASGP